MSWKFSASGDKEKAIAEIESSRFDGETDERVAFERAKKYLLESVAKTDFQVMTIHASGRADLFNVSIVPFLRAQTT